MTNYQVFELLSGLKSRQSESRHRAIRELLHFVKTDLREMSQEAHNQILDDFNQQIHALTSSYDNNEKKAGILTIVCLISGDSETSKVRVNRYVHHLRNIFPNSETSILELAAKTMGRLAVSLGIKRAEYVEFEVKRCFDWLIEERNEGKRLSAALILKELAIALPSYFFQHINGFFNHISIALRDPKESIREAAAKALRAAFVVTAQREVPEQSNRAHWYIQSYEEAMTSFADHTSRERGLSRDDHVHGALLILNELLRCSNSAWEKKYTMLMQKLDVEQESIDEMSPLNFKMQNTWSSQHYVQDKNEHTTIHESTICKLLITENYEKISSDVMAQQISRSHHVHQMLLIIIPRLAAFNKEAFGRKHLKSTINHLITFLRGREKEKAMAFTTLGLICVAVEADVQQYLGRIIEIIKLTLPVKDTPKKRNGADTPLFNCVTLLGFAMKENVATELKDLLDPMCVTGLSPQLTTCFKELSQNVPSLKKDITDKLLNILSLILRKKPYVTNKTETPTFMLSSALLTEAHDAAKLVLALRTLGAFDFEWNNTLMSFIKRCTDHYLQSEQHDVRVESVKTTAKLLSKAIERGSMTNSRTLMLVDESLGKLLSVGRSDFDHEVRYRVLEIFTNPIFDKYLAVEEHLNCFFVATNDSNSDVSELALCIVGRLSNLNPSYTTPMLRQLFVQILMELQYSESTRNKEQSLRMVNNIISNAPRITRQFADTILKVLVPKLKEEDSNSAMVCTILKAIGDLAEVNGGEHALSQWLHELISIQLDILSDPNQPEKRSVALWSFGQIISAIGYAVTPYVEYPNLIDMLLNFLKSDQHPSDRRETIRVLGLLGALDPYKHRVNQGLIDFQTISTLIPVTETSATADNFDSNVSEMLVNMSPLVLDEFYPAIAVTSLMRILRDPMLSQYHTSVVHSVTFIFRTLGIKCVPYISRVTPSLLYVIRTTDNSNFREFLLTQLAQLISVVKIHIRVYLEDIFDIIREYWTPKNPLQPTLILLVEHISVAIGTEFKVYLRKILPNILRVLKNDHSKDRFLTEKLLLAIQKFENNLDDVLLSIVPAITALFEGRNIPTSISKLAMETIEHLSMYLYFKPFSAMLIQALAKVLDNSPSLRQTAMNTLCALIVQLGREYIDYIPSVDRILVRHKIQCPNYIVLVSRLQVISTLASDDDYLDETRSRLRNQKSDVMSTNETQSIQKLTLNVQNLRKCWSLKNLISKEDWLEWLKQLSVGLLTESNSPAIRACSNLAQNYIQLAIDLFNASFMSCWTELGDQPRCELVAALEKALTVPDVPELALAVLNLAEFLEHCEEEALPISIKLLGDTAISCRAYAKALYYKEEEYRRNPSTQVVEALIHINNKLQQKESATGLLEKVIMQKKSGDCTLNVHVRWYEKLHNWDQALELYTKKLETDPQDNDTNLGMMRCLEALGEWRKLDNIITDRWVNMSEDMRQKSAKIAAAASWGLQEWDSMKKYVECIPGDTQDGAFYRAIISIHDSQWVESRHYIDSARSLLDADLTAVVGESYQRAYGALVNAQLLTELEEVVTYKLVEERRSTIQRAWTTRLQGGQRLVEDWRKMLQIRSLVLTPREDFQTWLKFASLCRKTGALSQARKIVVSMLGCDPVTNPDVLLRAQDPRIVLAYSKNIWDAGNKRYAYDVLQRFVDSAEPEHEEQCRLLARCHLKLGSWCESLQEVNELSIPEILRNYATATILAPEWYKACHAWACMNFETVLFYKQQDNVSESSLAGSGEKKVSRAEFINTYTIPAIEGFFKSISLSNGSSLQDTLRLLTLWFEHGHHPAIYDALFEGIRQIDIKIWLQVIPQLIARIDSPRSLVAKLVHILLIDIGKSHPQALVYPLTVATKSSFVTRKTAANYILKTMSTHSQMLVSEAAIISEELIKIAMLWHDQVYTALEDASTLYFNEKDYRGMFRTLEKMHAMLDQPPETLKEVSFLQMYGRDLQEAQRMCEMYKETNEDRYLNEAWHVYFHVARRIGAQFKAHTSLELQYVSRRLHACRQLQLAVPGSYVPAQRVIRIAHIHTHLQVIKSKQRPRRLTIQGSDGKQYMFLLKGHEDLRQDERVMQLFGLVNTLLQADTNTYRHDLAIQRYAVIPLSPNSGLIGWVPQCDTLYKLISDYRDKKSNKMTVCTEQNIMKNMASEYQKLMLKHKVEVFEYTLSQTPGNDLSRLLWLKSPSAEAWFERRTNYTRSLAVMSMVGYILGLGDRHPSNIMLHRVTGKVLHIDFGDCFEVTQKRERFPEKIPFRLTRMLINAMEVTGIEGAYRFTCEAVMQVLHKHRDSVMAVLEAFVYDPLLNWRLIDNEKHSITESTFSSDMDSPYSLPSRSRNHLHYESLEMPPEANLNKRALAILNRIRDKLTGRDFPYVEAVVSVPKQVDLLIKIATNNENLCQCYVGWCPFW